MSDLTFFSPNTTVAQPEPTTQYIIVYPSWIADDVSGTNPQYEARTIYFKPLPELAETRSLGCFNTEEAARIACQEDWQNRKAK
jgi:hypothetical protein